MVLPIRTETLLGNPPPPMPRNTLRASLVAAGVPGSYLGSTSSARAVTESSEREF